jgi:hypothetical protein
MDHEHTPWLYLPSLTFFLTAAMTVTRSSSALRAAAEEWNNGAALINNPARDERHSGGTAFYRHLLQVEPAP